MASTEGGNWPHRAWRLLKIVLGGRPGRISEGTAATWTASRKVLQVKVALLDIKPTIWRRLLIPGHHTLGTDWRPETFRLDEVKAMLRDSFSPAETLPTRKAESSERHPRG